MNIFKIYFTALAALCLILGVYLLIRFFRFIKNKELLEADKTIRRHGYGSLSPRINLLISSIALIILG